MRTSLFSVDYSEIAGRMRSVLFRWDTTAPINTLETIYLIKMLIPSFPAGPLKRSDAGNTQKNFIDFHGKK